MLETKNCVAEMKTAFSRLTSRLNTAEEGISALKHIAIESLKSKKMKSKKKMEQSTQKLWTAAEGISYE